MTLPQSTPPSLPLIPWQACITSVLTKNSSEEAPCPKCKKPVRLGDLKSVGGGGGGASAASGGGGSSYGIKTDPYQQYGDERSYWSAEKDGPCVFS